MTAHPVFVQRIVSGDGAVRASLTVFCSHEGQTIDFARCGACERFARVDGEDRRGPVITCHVNAVPMGAGPTLARIMSRDVLCVTRDVPVRLVGELLLERSIGAVPVVDPEGRAVGLVSKTDVLGALLAGKTARAADVMMSTLFALPESAPVARAAALMAAEGIHRVLVVDAERRVVGVVSALDIARSVASS
jgi:CBS domain-containing protein